MYTTIAASSKNRESADSYAHHDSINRRISQDAGTDHNNMLSDKSISGSADSKRLYKLFQQEYSIMAEYKMLQSENMHGVYVIPSFENSFLWYGVIFVRSGCYEGGVFRFILSLPETFPECECPTVTFQSQIFHPAIDPNTGVLALGEVFPKWTKSNNHIWQILKYIHWTFQNINVKSPFNAEALKQYKTNKIVFSEKAKESVMLSMDHLYDEPPTDDKHYICFSPYDPSIHDSVKISMLNPSSPTSIVPSQGLSWVQPGTFKPFTKPTEEEAR